MAKVRIQKVLSEVGVASRRAIEEMIVEGWITVNGKLVIELPCFVDPETDRIMVRDTLVRLKDTGPKHYILLNKPKDVVCTSRDELGRKRAIDCVPGIGARLYCVGRLDADSTGLILLTNDGELTQHLTHPSHGVIKTYIADIDGHLTAEKIATFKKGVWMDGRRTSGAMIRVLKRAGRTSLLQVRLTEGRNREIRRVLARLGHKVRRLHRAAIGPINDRGLKVGSWRELAAAEVDKLRRAGGFTADKAPATPPRRSTRATSDRIKKTQTKPRKKPTAAAKPRRTTAARPGAGRKPTGRKPAGGARKSSGPGRKPTQGRRPAAKGRKPSGPRKGQGGRR
ncbi:MAG: pseudouridine synthase [Planctomycetota bacterium]|jgi:23S rRNA pseudouridine2605 synthase